VTRTHTIACLTGGGTAPELMSEAVLALERVCRLHNVRVHEQHASFGGVAFARGAQMVPAATRAALHAADAVLVAGAEEPTLAQVVGELDLRAQATRVRFGSDDDVVVLAPRFADACEWTIEKAFAVAEHRSLRLAAVGDAYWTELVGAVAAGHEHVAVEHVPPRLALPLAAFHPYRFDVVVVAPAWAEALGDVVAASAAARVAAHGLLAEHGPSLFVPSADGGFALAGTGVVNPSSMLLAVATMLDLGLGNRGAAETLARAVSAALVDGPRTPDLLQQGMGATTREFTRHVIDAFQLTQPWSAAA
jgi:3-isopropylmalate dehydrogenase